MGPEEWPSKGLHLRCWDCGNQARCAQSAFYVYNDLVEILPDNRSFGCNPIVRGEVLLNGSIHDSALSKMDYADIYSLWNQSPDISERLSTRRHFSQGTKIHSAWLTPSRN
jgi:hypothetical protein